MQTIELEFQPMPHQLDAISRNGLTRDEAKPTRWRVCLNPDGSKTATLECGGCGRRCSLAEHTISPDGSVRPSVLCPRKGCGYHAFVTLQGWPG